MAIVCSTGLVANPTDSQLCLGHPNKSKSKMWNATPGDAWRSNGAAIQPFIQLVFQHLETPQPSECPQVIAKSAPLGRLVGKVNSQGLQGKLHLHLAKPQKSIDAVLSNPILKW
jgi:ABC-type Fe2+-enterobactin transport system substrate-binding protein